MRKRMIIATVTVLLFCAGLSCRLGFISLGSTYAVEEGFHSYSLLIDNVEPNIYDRNGVKLTNNITEYCAVLRSDEATFNALASLVPEEEIASIVERLQSGKPFLYFTDSRIDVPGIPVYEIKTSHSSCQQLLSRRSSGLLSCLPDSIGNKKINFSVDARGRILSGDKGTVTESSYHSMEGLKLTLDNQVQNALCQACSTLKSGCALIMDVRSASVLACVSKPDDTYLNKCFSSYPVGSVFKIVVALCALENGVNPEYDCKAHITVGDITFSCYKNKAHGKQFLKQALANSCNCYFVNLALALGADKLRATAEKLGFNDETVIYSTMKVKNASLPDNDSLISKGELALLGFGQGKLTSTPLQFGSLLCTVCHNGVKMPIKLVQAEVTDNGREKPISYPDGVTVEASENCQELLSYLRYVVTNGNSAGADYKNASAGKTATAQTGQFRNGEELLTTWFAGVYPYPEPEYAIVIVCEEGTGGAADCCPIFRTVVEILDNL